MAKRDATRLALLRTAERLFAERGVDNVSLREIAAAAGQRNHSAVLYHFGDKRELLEAFIARHSPSIASTFAADVAKLQAEGRENLETLVRVLVEPLVRKLDDEDGGADYIYICNDLSNSRTYPLTSLRSANSDGALLITQRLVEHAGMNSLTLLPVRMHRVASVMFGSIASFQRLCAAGLYLPRHEFTEELIETIVVVINPRYRWVDR